MIPGGQAFYVLVNGNVSNYTWIPDLAPETTVIFMMEDSKGRKGGVSLFTPVNAADDSSCLNSNSPSSQAVAPSSTVFQSSSQFPTATQSRNSYPSSVTQHLNVGALAGGVAAGVVVVLVVAGVVLFCIRRRKRNGMGGHSMRPSGYPLEEANLMKGNAPNNSPPPSADFLTPSFHYSDRTGISTASVPCRSTTAVASNVYNGGAATINYAQPITGALQHDAPLRSPDHDGSAYLSPPSQGMFVYSSGNSSQLVPIPSPARPNQSAPAGSGSSIGVPSDKSAGPERPRHTPRPVIVHTDMEDEVPEPEDEVPIELPPQYSERRAPRFRARAVGATPEKARRNLVNAFSDGEP